MVGIVVALLTTSTLAVSAEPVRSLPWGDCPDLGLPPVGLQCATLDVPLDHRNPRAGTLQVAVSRLASTNPARRRGVLLMNPGGPGDPGLGMPAAVALSGVSPAILEAYDLIGFDPRGIDHSSPVSCALPPEHQTTNIPPYARDAAEVTARATVARDIAAFCATGPSAAVLPFINTANTARDMDRIRVALGERTISYYGGSYGTYLGAVYASLFPDRTDRFLLDSAWGPAGLDVNTSRRFGLGFQQRFPDFAAWAAARDDTYHLGATAERVTTRFFELAEELDRNPVQGVDGPFFRVITFALLYQDAFFPELATIWQTLSTTAATSLGALADPGVENQLAAQLAVVCNDNSWPESIRTYQHNVAVDRIHYPMFGAAAANIWPCAFWPEQMEPPVRITNRGPSNILLLNNLRDPATPLVGALQMRVALGQRARMVTVVQGGHGVFLVAPNACGNETATAFLVSGTRPAHDTFCPAESVVATAGTGVNWLRAEPRISPLDLLSRLHDWRELIGYSIGFRQRRSSGRGVDGVVVRRGTCGLTGPCAACRRGAAGWRVGDAAPRLWVVLSPRP